jgi:hypothetical protein
LSILLARWQTLNLLSAVRVYEYSYDFEVSNKIVVARVYYTTILHHRSLRRGYIWL